MDELMCRMPTAGGNNAEGQTATTHGGECRKMGTNNSIVNIIARVMDVVPFQSATVLGCR